MSDVAHLDIETRSTVDLKTAGLYRYFEDELTEVIVVRWRIGDQRGDLNTIGPFIDHINSGGMIEGHNIAFDREGWNRKVALDRFPRIKPEQTDCTMARCAALSLPQGLEQAAKALQVPVQKDTEGRRLMLRMCRPKKLDPLTWRESREELERLSQYCATDVDAETAVSAVVPKLTVLQRRTWLLDQKINARGVKIDFHFAGRALELVELVTERANREVRALTKGAVEKTTQVARITDWLRSRGVPCASLGKGVIDDVIVTAEVLSDETACRVIGLRRASAKSSVSKYKAMQSSACRDQRARGTLCYHGASTGRWSGRLIQPQNFPRVNTDEEARAVAMLHDILADPRPVKELLPEVELWFENPLEVLSKALRSTIIADTGKRLIGGDFSNIEGRVNAWLAGESWKVKAFTDYDRGVGEDLYVLAYSKGFGVPVEQVTKPLRQRGKVMELSLGYQGGKRAFQKMAANYGLTVSDDAAESLKVAWRDAHPMIRNSWYELQDAAIEAVKYLGATVKCLSGRIAYKVDHNILWCRLPSGRCLAYPYPRITNQQFVNEDGEIEETERPQVAFMGVDSVTKRWGIHRLYGGLQCENVVQAIAYDLLVEGMFQVEDASYPIVLTVHDEILSEVPEGFGSVEEFEQLMTPSAEWASGLPIAVGAWEGERYAK